MSLECTIEQAGLLLMCSDLPLSPPWRHLQEDSSRCIQGTPALCCPLYETAAQQETADIITHHWRY